MPEWVMGAEVTHDDNIDITKEVFSDFLTYLGTRNVIGRADIATRSEGEC